MPISLSTLKDSYLLSTIPREQIEDYISKNIFKIVNYGKNNIIHFDGDQCTSLEILLSGKVVVDRIDEAGNLMTVTEFCSDNVLGGNLIFSKNPYFPMTVTAQVPTTILEIKKETIFDLCSENKDFLSAYLQIISDQTLVLGDKIKHYVNRSIRDCVLSYLNYEHRVQNSEKIQLNLTKKALAERMGVQRTSLSRELQKMKQEGIIDYDASSITILQKQYIAFQ